MDLSNAMKAVMGIIIVTIIVVVVAIPIISDVVNQKEIKIVPGQGEGPIDLMSSDVKFTNSGRIVVDGEQYEPAGIKSIVVLADTFVISHESQTFYLQKKSTNSTINCTASELKIIDGTLHYEDTSCESSWCHAYVETYPASTQTLIIDETGAIGPLEYGGGDVTFVAYYPGGVRHFAIYSIDEAGNVVYEWGSRELDTIDVTVTPIDGNYSISIEYSDEYMRMGFVIIDREYEVVASPDDPTFKLITVVPLIMAAGVLIAIVSSLAYYRS